ncbi:hypothetical protein G7Z12_37700 [Streptomyces sp. ID38640]|uniref:hypothetical protein n=1 Tax=Streptomyces sp. ID38640 TaxID=1265399 RepID=UPI00140F2E4E|nr:hypothetical protein [Streptomyces sp. ID38640]QIK04713.1 hypothetical protein G7Z12_00040 [Streptomyces sp. ID38640]QIK10878.1 hypothetical protein G7Z12_37335 [Streptomyces sp. ID38640]QIK10933.1 hypothetical protein G7Z12_37700 [Streptomyces sp. ID38640]
MLTTAELVLGLSRHLSAYGASQPKADLGQLEFAGKIIELAVRVRGSAVSTPERVAALGLDAGISKREVQRELLPALETLSLVDLERDSDHVVRAVSERVPPLPELFDRADAILAIAMPEPLERMAMEVLRQTTLMPMTVPTALEACASLGTEELACRAIEDLQSLHLCALQRSADGDEVLFNPNVWAVDKDHSHAAVQAENGAVRAALSGLLEEVSATAGFPEASVTSADKKWIDFAVSQGLLLRSLVTTASGEERSFLFSPHMGRSAFDAPTGADPSGHVRQLIGSMMFANRYASNRLFAPTAFLRKLIRNGEAGDASNIGTDYSMLETAGIVKVEPAYSYSKFVLLQADVAEQAVTYLDNTGSGGTASGGLRGQRSYLQPEIERARRLVQPSKDAIPSPSASQDILAALRQEMGRRRYDR